MFLSNTGTLPFALDQDQLDITVKVRSNPLTWNGQFSPQLIESLISVHGREAASIFDPFSGSGTVAAECIRAKKSFQGTEVNPAAFYLGNIYSLASKNRASREEAVDAALTAMLELCPTQNESINIEPTFINALNKVTQRLSGTSAETVLNCCVLLGFKSNRISSGKKLRDAFEKVRALIATFPCELSYVDFRLADARCSGFSPNSVDLTITSPPYINVYNYHQQYRPIIEALGYDALLSAKSEIGANRKHRGNRFLTVIQYCIDLLYVAQEISRLTKPSGAALIVIGRESNVLGQAFQNSHIANKVFVEVCNWIARPHQSRSFLNRFGQLIREDVLNYSVAEMNVDSSRIDAARMLGVEALKAIDTSGLQDANAVLINSAIEQSDNVKASNLFSGKKLEYHDNVSHSSF